MRPIVRAGAVGLALAMAWAGAPRNVGAEEQDARLEAVVGEWVFVQDRSTGPGNNPQMRPAQGTRFECEVKEGALVLTQVRQGKPSSTVFPLDGSEKVLQEKDSTRRTKGTFDADRFVGNITLDAPGREGKREVSVSKVTLAPTTDGLLVTLEFISPITLERVSFYKRTEDVPQAKPFKAGLDVIAWLSGAWTGTHGKTASEERWGPIGGGAMLGTAKTVAGNQMRMFEFLRIVERDGTLVYVAQPNGGPATEFTLTEATATRVVFENPAHDYPKRVVYERQGEKSLMTEISDTGGANPNRATYTREP